MKSRFFMPFIGFRTLSEIDPRKLTPKNALKIASSFMQFIVDMHQKHVHCDIKPGNIRLNKDLSVKLVDYAFAKPPGTPINFCGSLEYVPKEVVNLDEKIPAETSRDIYSACVTLFQILIAKDWSTVHPSNLFHIPFALSKRAPEMYPTYECDDESVRSIGALWGLIKAGFSLDKSQRPSAEALLECISELLRADATSELVLA